MISKLFLVYTLLITCTVANAKTTATPEEPVTKEKVMDCLTKAGDKQKEKLSSTVSQYFMFTTNVIEKYQKDNARICFGNKDNIVKDLNDNYDKFAKDKSIEQLVDILFDFGNHGGEYVFSAYGVTYKYNSSNGTCTEEIVRAKQNLFSGNMIANEPVVYSRECQGTYYKGQEEYFSSRDALYLFLKDGEKASIQLDWALGAKGANNSCDWSKKYTIKGAPTRSFSIDGIL